MTFISYAQNYEDVMLWRALGHLQKGFYFDIGAYSPDVDSITRAFYERGWSGINVEPNPKFLSLLNEQRSRDTNVGVAVSHTCGQTVLHVVDKTGLTTVEDDIANRHRDQGWSTSQLVVPTLTAQDIWDAHVPTQQDVHFLKIDVEGHEASVIAGLDWSRYRPWVVVVEVTVPNEKTLSDISWEEQLLSAGYAMVYWDGLNRFYLANEHGDLHEAFQSPPNVLDDFITSNLADARNNLDAMGSRLQMTASLLEELRQADRQRLERLLNEIQSNRADIRQLHDEFALLRAELHQVLAPPYLAGRPLWERLLFHETGEPKWILRRALFHTTGNPRGIFRNRVLRSDGTPCSPFRKWMNSPQYQALPRAVRARVPETQNAHITSADLSALTPRARQIYADLKRRIDQHLKDSK